MEKKPEEPELFKTAAALDKPNYQMKAMGFGCLGAIVVTIILAVAGLASGVFMIIPGLLGIGLYRMLLSEYQNRK